MATKRKAAKSAWRLQSANEELEGPKEELQSLNEELNSVNDQLQDKVAELERANNDLANLLSCTDAAILFLDNQFRIKRYTPRALHLFNLIAADLNRPISDITPKYPDSTLQQDVELVLRGLVPQEKQVQTLDGCWWNRRITVYRTLDNRIEGVVLTFNDITQVRRADEPARRLATVLQDSNDALTVHDFDGRIMSWNRSAERMFGYSESEALQRNAAQMLPEDLRAKIRTYWEQLRRGEHVDPWETQHINKSGHILDVWVTATALKDETGRPVAIAKTERDITERKRVEKTLRDSEEQFRGYFENVAVGTSQIDKTGRFFRVNDRYCAITGYRREELVGGMGPLDLDHPDDREADCERLAKFLGGKAPLYEAEKRYVRKDGGVVWVHVSATSVRDAAGSVRYTVGVIEDITARKQAEHALKQLNASLETQVAERTLALRNREACLHAILNAAPDAIITIDAHGIIQSVNAASEKMFGYAASEMIGQNVKVLMSSPYREEHDGYLANYAQTGIKKMIGIGREAVARRQDGSKFPVELAVSEVEQLMLFTGIVRDMTRRKELEREVVEIASLEQRRIGQDLHDSVSQELTALNMQADILPAMLRPNSSNESKLVEKMIQGLQRSQKELRAVMRGLLPVAVDTEGLMAALSDLADHVQQEGKTNCKFDCPEPVAIADNLTATHLYLIAQEVVHNALKHARPRNIRISLESNDLLVLRVQDDGIGMPAQPSEDQGGLGLRIMRNRAAIISATLTIKPAEPTGTLVACALVRKQNEREHYEEAH